MKSILKALILSLCLISVAHAAPDKPCPSGDQRLMSPDKSWFVCFVESDGKFSVSINGKPGTPYDWTGFPDFSPDSRRLAYKARIGNEWFVVTGDSMGKQKKGKSYSEIESVIWNLDYPAVKFSVFGPSGTLAYSARQGDEWYIVSQDHESPPYDWSRPIIFSQDGSKLGYKAKLADKWFVVINDKPGEAYDWVGIPIFSPDSKKFAYKARSGSEWFMVIGDEPEKAYDSVGFPAWSPDSKQIAYKAKSGDKWSVVVGDKAGKRYDGVISLSDKNDYRDFDILTFTDDSQDVEYAALEGGTWLLVTGEIEGAAYAPKRGPEPTKRSVVKVSASGVIAEFQNANAQMRSIASRIETRLDKLAEKEGFEDMDLRAELATARLMINMSEEDVIAASGIFSKDSLKSAKKHVISAKAKLTDIINDIKQK